MGQPNFTHLSHLIIKLEIKFYYSWSILVSIFLKIGFKDSNKYGSPRISQVNHNSTCFLAYQKNQTYDRPIFTMGRVCFCHMQVGLTNRLSWL